jgi:ribonucleoside-triphosphate reductase (formate)
MSSARAEAIYRRTYSRPVEGGFEQWPDTVDRVIRHQRWLWQRALGDVPLEEGQQAELEELRQLLLARKVSVSGRTLWLGGTEVAKRREASMFNCAFTKVETVHDVVDAFWLLLQGCGVGFAPVVGTLNGFTKEMEVELVASQRHLLEQKHGREENLETHTHEDGRTVWTISIGDSAEAWAKAVGKLLAGKRAADVLRLDFSQIRPAGERLAGYGWISSGDETFRPALERIAHLLNARSGRLLSRIDILDILNLLGTTLSSRRSAEIALVPYGDAEWREFATAKKDFWLHDRAHRQQSNNSLIFMQKPTRDQLEEVFELMKESGGSEPGFINGAAAKVRAPWWSGVNPCAEIMLPNKGFCNLVEVNLTAFNNDWSNLVRAMWLVARANYRQTCVNLRDGILQSAWHENNEFLRLCGVGVTGVVGWLWADSKGHWEAIREVATDGATSMADELGLPKPKAVTTIKPSGTLSKVMDTTEGIHMPMGKYIFNNVRFGKHDPMVKQLKKAHYRVFNDPTSPDAVLVTFPVAYEGVQFTEVNGVEVNLESALEQLERYKRVMENYVDHNCSITVSYDLDEVPAIVDWLLENWDTYVGVSFIYRNDPTKTAKDLGYLYLPQEVVTKEVYDEYVKGLLPLTFAASGAKEVDHDWEIDTGEECAGGVCPIR